MHIHFVEIGLSLAKYLYCHAKTIKIKVGPFLYELAKFQPLVVQGPTAYLVLTILRVATVVPGGPFNSLPNFEGFIENAD